MKKCDSYVLKLPSFSTVFFSLSLSFFLNEEKISTKNRKMSQTMNFFLPPSSLIFFLLSYSFAIQQGFFFSSHRHHAILINFSHFFIFRNRLSVSHSRVVRALKNHQQSPKCDKHLVE